VTGNVLTSPLTPQTFLICGILWGGVYIALFRLALTRQRPVRPALGWAGTTLDLTRAATLVLMALGLMVISTVAFSFSNPTDVADIRAVFGRWLTGWPDPAVYMVFSSLVSLIALLIPTRLLGSGGTMRPVSAGLLVGCLFTVAIAPGLMILCVPFTLALYLSTLIGSAAGAVIGGAMGSWWALRAR
jgi:hypothetical protein